MFDNAWLYNRKTSRVYKYCSKVASLVFTCWFMFFNKYFTGLYFPHLEIGKVSAKVSLQPIMQKTPNILQLNSPPFSRDFKGGREMV